MSRGARTGHLLLPAAVALVVVVALTASSDTQTGSGAARPPAQWLVDVFASLVLVLLAFGTVLLVVLVVLRPQELVEQVAGRERRRGRAGVTIGLVVAALLVALALRRFVGADGGSGPGIDGGSVTDAAAGLGDTRYEPAFATSAMAVVLGVAALTIGAAYLVVRSARTDTTGPRTALQDGVADALDDTLDDLRAEGDPRRAVIAAYARLEKVFAAHGVPRLPSEAPREYLSRVLRSLAVPERAALRLTELFATARFSQHDVGPGMKDEAIDALECARDELRRAAERERAEQARALLAARERAAS